MVGGVLEPHPSPFLLVLCKESWDQGRAGLAQAAACKGLKRSPACSPCTTPRTSCTLQRQHPGQPVLNPGRKSTAQAWAQDGCLWFPAHQPLTLHPPVARLQPPGLSKPTQGSKILSATSQLWCPGREAGSHPPGHTMALPCPHPALLQPAKGMQIKKIRPSGFSFSSLILSSLHLTL